MEILEHALHHAVTDTLKLIPFLFVTYLVMEFIEHKTGSKTRIAMEKAGKFGPVIGSVVGIVPQCGFSAAASNLYAGRLITMGTLMAIFLSTSDEMLPILISAKMPVEGILKILALKVGIGIVAGLIIDMIVRRKKSHEVDEHDHIHDICEREHCNCENGIFISALMHTLKITIFIFLITFALNLIIEYIGEDNIGNLILNKPVVGELVAGIVGLIPNCAASVVITQMYIDGLMGFGAMMSGVLVGAGVGLLVLFRSNRNWKENLMILGILYFIGVVSGVIINLTGITV